MTITEQLQFSVLSAPVAGVDRRALSQAWYSALYGTSRSVAAARRAQTGASAQRAATGVGVANGGSALAWRSSTQTPRNAPQASKLSQSNAPERRAPRSDLARKIESALLRPRKRSGKTSFTFASASGRVHVLLQSSGSRLRLIAICSPKARAHVAAALAQARYALALRGVQVEATTREAAC